MSIKQSSTKMNGVAWSEQENDILRNMYYDSPKDDIIEALPNRTWKSICQHAVKGLHLKRYPFYKREGAKYWSDKEEDLIAEMIKCKSVKDIALYFHVPYNKMIDKIHKMGLNAKAARGELWNKTEEQVLMDHYEFAPRDYILRLIPDRSWNLICQHAKKVLKLTRKANDKQYVNYRFFDDWTEESAYVFGLLLADGYIHKSSSTGQKNIGKNMFCISLHQKDIDCIYKVAAAMQFCGKINIDEKRTQASITCYNYHMICKLEEMGMPMINKTYSATFPMNNIPKEYLRHCIRGLIDGDGWSSVETGFKIRKQEGEYSRYVIGLCGTEAVVTSVKNCLPVDCSTNKVNHTVKHCWSFNIQGEKALSIAEWLYKDSKIYMDRKYNAYLEAKKLYSPS